jgi:hypothetical protein
LLLLGLAIAAAFLWLAWFLQDLIWGASHYDRDPSSPGGGDRGFGGDDGSADGDGGSGGGNHSSLNLPRIPGIGDLLPDWPWNWDWPNFDIPFDAPKAIGYCGAAGGSFERVPESIGIRGFGMLTLCGVITITGDYGFTLTLSGAFDPGGPKPIWWGGGFFYSHGILLSSYEDIDQMGGCTTFVTSAGTLADVGLNGSVYWKPNYDNEWEWTMYGSLTVGAAALLAVGGACTVTLGRNLPADWEKLLNSPQFQIIECAIKQSPQCSRRLKDIIGF